MIPVWYHFDTVLITECLVVEQIKFNNCSASIIKKSQLLIALNLIKKTTMAGKYIYSLGYIIFKLGIIE
jgi:hypothetical protein